MLEVGVRELKTHLSVHLKRVKAGETLTVTEYGKPVAQLVPLEPVRLPPHLAELITAGRASWSGQRLPPMRPIPMAPGDQTIAEMVSEDRR